MTRAELVARKAELEAMACELKRDITDAQARLQPAVDTAFAAGDRIAKAAADAERERALSPLRKARLTVAAEIKKVEAALAVTPAVRPVGRLEAARAAVLEEQVATSRERRQLRAAGPTSREAVALKIIGDILRDQANWETWTAVLTARGRMLSRVREGLRAEGT